jgi:hypothetical protein
MVELDVGGAVILLNSFSESLDHAVIVDSQEAVFLHSLLSLDFVVEEELEEV